MISDELGGPLSPSERALIARKVTDAILGPMTVLDALNYARARAERVVAANGGDHICQAPCKSLWVKSEVVQRQVLVQCKGCGFYTVCSDASSLAQGIAWE